MCIVIMLICIYEFACNLSKYRIGYLPTISPKILNTILDIPKKYYSEKKSQELNFVELGSGLANVTTAISKNKTFGQNYAVEVDFVWHYLAKFMAFLGRAKINFVHKNVFKYTSPKDSVIYCYLGSSIIQRLYEEGFFKGNIMVSTTFWLKDVEPTETIKLGGFYGRVFVYDFRK